MKKIKRYGFLAVLLMSLLTACPNPANPGEQEKPSFELELSRSTLDVIQGTKQTVDIRLRSAENFKDEVAVRIKSEAAGLTTEFDTTILSEAGNVLSVEADINAEVKTHTLVIDASTESGLTKSKNLSVNVKALEQNLPVPDLEVDTSVKPVQDVILDTTGTPRPVGAVVTGDRIKAQFVLDELLISTSDKGALAAFLARWDGSILDEIDFGGNDLPTLYVVKLDPTGVDKTKLKDNLRELGGVGETSVSFSSQSGLDLLAVAANEMAEKGLISSLNWIPEPTGIVEGSSQESSTGTADYTPDAFQWPYIKRGAAQNTGVDVAWQSLHALGKFDIRDRVKIMVIDGGFIDLGDYGENANLEGVRWGTANAWSCSGGDDCPWHGTAVAHTALGQLDNGLGVAGPGGPVAELEALQFGGGFDFRVMARMLGLALVAPLLEAPDIINVSASVEVPPVLNVGVNRLLDPIFDRIHDRGILVIASAGNSNIDVDEKVTVLGANLWEESTVIPCETSSVLCVGGMAWDSTDKADNSNYGSDREADSVDIYAPYTVWVPKVEDNGSHAGDVEKISGTSFSAPFVAGVAALIKASNPGFEAAGITNCLLRTAHIDALIHTRGGNQRRVDAFGAVACALPRDTFPLVKILEPSASVTAVGRSTLEFKAFGVDENGLALPVSWASDLDGFLSTFGPNTPFRTDMLSVGTHTLTASVRDAEGNMQEDSIQVTITNNAPTVSISAPVEGSSIGTSQSIALIGRSEDIDTGSLGLEDSQVRWSIAGTSFSASGHRASIPAGFLSVGTHTITFTGNDGEASASDSITIEITECVLNCPSLVIVTPLNNATIHAPSFSEDIGYSVDIDFSGIATDVEDGRLSGKAMSWSVINEEGRRTSICTPISSDLIDIGCDTFTAKLSTGEGKLSHTYTVIFTVIDSDGNTATSSVVITVKHELI